MFEAIVVPRESGVSSTPRRLLSAALLVLLDHPHSRMMT
jgi:hypothetical protein